MNLEDLTLKELVLLQDMIDDLGRERALQTPFMWHGSVDQLDESNIVLLENMYKAIHNEHPNTEQLLGSYENEPIEKLIGKEAMKKILDAEHAVSGGNDSAIRGNLESAIYDGTAYEGGKFQREESFNHIQYLKSILQDPYNIDQEHFRAAVSRGVQDNSMLISFVEELSGHLGEQLNLIIMVLYQILT